MPQINLTIDLVQRKFWHKFGFPQHTYSISSVSSSQFIHNIQFKILLEFYLVVIVMFSIYIYIVIVINILLAIPEFGSLSKRLNRLYCTASLAFGFIKIT